MKAAEMLAVIVLATVASCAWALVTVTASDCHGQSAEPNIRSWVLAVPLMIVGPAWGGIRSNRAGISEPKTVAIVTTGTVFSALFVIVGLYAITSLIDCA